MTDYFARCCYCGDALEEHEAEHCHTCGLHCCRDHKIDVEGGANKCLQCVARAPLHEAIRAMAQDKWLFDTGEMIA